MARVETRVARIAEELLAERQRVRPIDVLVGLGWLAQPNVDRWERGRIPSIDRCVGVDSDKVRTAFAALQQSSEDRGLKPSKPTTGICNAPPTATLIPSAPTALSGRRPTCLNRSSSAHPVPGDHRHLSAS